MKAYKYINRYEDEFTFTPQEDGTVLWEGNFEYSRIGCPNDYTQAFFEYIRDTEGGITLEEFKDLVHAYDNVKEEYIIERKYRELIKSNTAVISMVDPSGGPYITEGTDLSFIHSGLKDKIVDRLESVENGWKIILK